LETLVISTPKPILATRLARNLRDPSTISSYFSQYPPYPTPCYPYHSSHPQPVPQPHPSQLSIPTQLLIPPFPNPHIEVSQSTYNDEVQHFQTSPLEINGIHHSSGRVFQKRDSLDTIEGLHPEEEDSNEKTIESWATLDEEQTSKSKIKRAPSCIQEKNQQKGEYLKFMVEEDMRNDPDKQENQGHESYTEVWF